MYSCSCPSIQSPILEVSQSDPVLIAIVDTCLLVREPYITEPFSEQAIFAAGEVGGVQLFFLATVRLAPSDVIFDDVASYCLNMIISNLLLWCEVRGEMRGSYRHSTLNTQHSTLNSQLSTLNSQLLTLNSNQATSEVSACVLLR